MMKYRVYLLILSLLAFPFSGKSDEVVLTVDFSGEGKPLTNFWRASGFTPGVQLLREDMQLTLDYLAAIPHEGIRYLRPHWLLNMVRVEDPYGDDPEYDFSVLYQALDEMVKRDLKPVFEVMGYPRILGEAEGGTHRQGAMRWVPDFKKPAEIQRWHDFVRALVSGLEARYGREELLTWYFECTNEPDGSDHFWDQGIPALLNYWDATGEAIKSVHPEYVFGGPGNAHLLSETFKAVLDHAENGANAITGERGSVLDFISVHHKARPYQMIRMERQSFRYVREHHPALAELPFWNNEADPTWGWGEAMWWRPNAWYAAFLVQSVETHLRLLIDREEINYGYLVNDHNFLGDWYQRTLLARFSAEANPSRFQLLPKPVYYGMALLSFAEGTRHAVEGYSSEESPVVLLAVRRDSGEILLLLAHGPDFGDPRDQVRHGPETAEAQQRFLESQTVSGSIALTGHSFTDPVYTHIRLDQEAGNAYGRWQELGTPAALDHKTYRELLSAGQPVLARHNTAWDGNPIPFSIRGAGVSLFVISERGAAEDAPAPVIRKVTSYATPDGKWQDFIRWTDPADRVVAYDVWASHDGGAYEKINARPVLIQGFAYPRPEGVETVSYRVERRME
ncbi:MAG: hypothetical protein JJU29_20800 [Verrucomicrobia bacterium]|nr:hypothetical protein [Verrucomicrobiota bacterium]MCH8514434.1 hypothetical protein [Kiritimatiellia bacterium]